MEYLVTAGFIILCLGGGALALVLYLLPAIIALYRSHRNAPAICVLSILFGWTGLAWIIALIWSFTDPRS